MYYCPDCGFEFKTPQKIIETHSLPCEPYEIVLVCPDCKSTAFYEKITTHCRCCGAKLVDSQEEYCCEACEKRGRLLRKRQLKKRQLAIKSPLGIIIKEIELYNKINNKNLSYGQYVALVERKEKSKCPKKKKRNT